MGITLLVVAIVIGIVGRSNPRLAVAITVVLILVTAGAILSRTGASVLDVLPILIGGAGRHLLPGRGLPAAADPGERLIRAAPATPR